ncbi:uncharacterized protein PAC_16992 [Phialocephala subalpina]|uniref:Uncharacterized protein n=1 Tax=Phialocephala subalpina TaxID=576137 RepID=A0A1L7XPZ1_9HELO|nr:uncharacterized protein PAC_16992 [Phialocephala subalpina]
MASTPFQIFPPSSASAPTASSTSFSISCPVDGPTDVWRKPSNPIAGNEKEVRTFNAPIIYKKVPLAKFKRVRVTVKGKWERLYDQGGVVLVLPPNGGEIKEPELKWVKAGIEFYMNEPFVGHVACEKWADWSLTQAGITPDKSITIEFEKDPSSGTLWIYTIGSKGERYPIREVTWVFADENLGEGKEVWVGVYAATPIMEGRESEKDGLVVEFEGWELDVEG